MPPTGSDVLEQVARNLSRFTEKASATELLARGQAERSHMRMAMEATERGLQDAATKPAVRLNLSEWRIAPAQVVERVQKIAVSVRARQHQQVQVQSIERYYNRGRGPSIGR